jgi:hypothetical protein
MLFFCDPDPLICCLEGDPLSHPKGEAAHGVHPFDPSIIRGFQQSPNNQNLKD